MGNGEERGIWNWGLNHFLLTDQMFLPNKSTMFLPNHRDQALILRLESLTSRGGEWKEFKYPV